MRRVVYGFVMVAACGEVPAVKNDGGVVEDAPSTTADAAPCQELVTQCASTTVLRACTTLGQAPIDTTCDLGCSPDNGAHCRGLEPGLGLVPEDLRPTPGLTDITMSATTTINTTDGSITNLRAAGTGVISGIEFTVRDTVGIFRFQKLTITGGSSPQSMSFTGTNSVALVAINSIEATGTIFNVQGTCVGITAGPGGIAGGGGGGLLTNGSAALSTRGGKGGVADDVDGDYSGGGGGGGHAGNGGAGATGLTYAGGAGGQLDSAVAFTGGGGGGGGAGSESNNGGSGGGGGGAIHLAANVLVKINGGGINAGGCGGNPGMFSDGGGGGGGAGGIIVLQGNDVEIANATLAANGGGGGGGTRGTHGLLGVGGAAGGPASGSTDAGGAGSTSTVLNGTSGVMPAGYGGGGGGAAGRIVLRSGDGVFATGNAVFSPAATMNGTVPIN